jgi:fatty-acyl-CoA synthase
VSEHFATLWEALADTFGDQPALIHGERVRTWSEFEDRSARLAAGFLDAGVGPGDTVAIDLYNCSEYLEVFFAALKVRAVPANVNYRYVGQEMRDLLEQAEARVLVHHASLADRVSAACQGLQLKLAVVVEGHDGTFDAGPQPSGETAYERLLASSPPAARIDRPGSDVFLSFTGGTTGLPKGVEYVIDRSLNNTAVLGRLNLGLDDLDWSATPFDRAVALRQKHLPPLAVPASPMMHSTGLIMASLPVLALGGTVATLTSRSFDADELFRTVEQFRPTTVSIVGDAFARPMLRALEAKAAAGTPYDASSLVTITSAGVAWSGDVKESLLQHIPQVTLVDSCGSTEGATIGSQVVRRGDRASTDAFIPAQGLLLIRPEDGSVISPDSDELGQFLLPTVGRGYRNDPVRTAAVFRTLGEQRYVLPGDWGRWNPDGTVTLVGRGTSTINTGGEKVFPEEVQKAALMHAGVEDCLVIGIPDERFGQRVVALVQPIAGHDLDAEALLSSLRTRLAGYKVPRETMIGKVPRAPNGKVLFDDARAMFLRQETPSQST